MIYTKKQLEDMNDFDLNCIAAINAGYDESWANRHSDLVPKYCESSDDIMPLCFAEGISLFYLRNSECWTAECNGFDKYASCEHKNPLRAAVIVYILVMQSK